MRELSDKQVAFVEAYAGDVKAAAKMAGISYGYARRLVTNGNILSKIRDRQKERFAAAIATREERQDFWTRMMRDEDMEPRDRLRASELLGKSEADFTEKIEHSGEIAFPVVEVMIDD